MNYRIINHEIIPVVYVSDSTFNRIESGECASITLPYDYANKFFRQPQNHTYRPHFPPHFIIRTDTEELQVPHLYSTYAPHPTDPDDLLVEVFVDK